LLHTFKDELVAVDMQVKFSRDVACLAG
jgi:hypothetical protein